MTSESHTTLIILGCIFLFILLVFLFLLSCFTWRGYKARRGRGTAARVEQQQQMPPCAQEKVDRWSTRTRGSRKVLQVVDDVACTGEEYLVGPVDVGQDQHSAAEWGAQINHNETRSYLNGWFALARPVATISSFSSSGTQTGKQITASVSSRGQHQRIQDAEWEVASEDELDLKLQNGYDKKAYRPSF